MQSVLKDRMRFANAASKTILSGLNEQLAPVLKKIDIHYQSHSLEHLISPVPLRNALVDIYNNVGVYFAKNQLKGLSSKSAKLLMKDDVDDFDTDEWDKYVDDFIQTIGAKMIARITETTKMAVRDFISAAIKNGTGAAQLGIDLRKHFADFNKVRSMVIARTEVARAQNFGTFTAGAMSGYKLIDTWLHAGSSKDDRETHVAADGMQIDRGDTFKIDSNYSPAYPHDGTGGAEEECNCNCTFFSTPKNSEY